MSILMLSILLCIVFYQKNSMDHDRPIYLASMQLNNVENNYLIIERKALEMIYLVLKYQHYLLGYKFTFHIDYDALKYMNNKS